MNMKYKKPIVFFIYKRPTHTLRVLQAINNYNPNKVYLVADGPKNDDEIQKCREVRQIAESFLVKHKIKFSTNYSDHNLGGPKRIPTGLNQVFDQESDAIILEDDCVPSLSFFYFCETLLDYYKDDSRIGVISGNNFQRHDLEDESYYFSIFNHCWGWATWKQAWQKYDEGLANWPDYNLKKHLNNLFSNKKYIKYWSNIFENVFSGEKVHWDYTWTFTCWSNNFLTVIPAKNLVTNVGFDSEATNTKNDNDPNANILSKELNFPLKHPNYISRSYNYDLYTQKYIFGPPMLHKRIFRKIISFFV